MIAVLEFDLDNHEDRMAHLRCIKSLEMAIALFEIKHNSHRHVDSVEKYQENIDDAIGNLNLNELIE